MLNVVDFKLKHDQVYKITIILYHPRSVIISLFFFCDKWENNKLYKIKIL